MDDFSNYALDLQMAEESLIRALDGVPKDDIGKAVKGYIEVALCSTRIAMRTGTLDLSCVRLLGRQGAFPPLARHTLSLKFDNGLSYTFDVQFSPRSSQQGRKRAAVETDDVVCGGDILLPKETGGAVTISYTSSTRTGINFQMVGAFQGVSFRWTKDGKIIDAVLTSHDRKYELGYVMPITDNVLCLRFFMQLKEVGQGIGDKEGRVCGDIVSIDNGGVLMFVCITKTGKEIVTRCKLQSVSARDYKDKLCVLFLDGRVDQVLYKDRRASVDMRVPKTNNTLVSCGVLDVTFQGVDDVQELYVYGAGSAHFKYNCDSSIFNYMLSSLHELCMCDDVSVCRQKHFSGVVCEEG